MRRLHDGSGFFIAEIDPDADPGPPVKWNPWNKVVQDHRDGTIHHDATNVERGKRGLPTPWVPAFAETEAVGQPVF